LSIVEGSGSMVIHYAGHVCMEPWRIVENLR
jgi:hypothetical protein